jgi:hypothetical protein
LASASHINTMTPSHASLSFLPPQATFTPPPQPSPYPYQCSLLAGAAARLDTAAMRRGAPVGSRLRPHSRVRAAGGSTYGG